MPKMIEAMSESVTAAYVKSLEDRIRVLEQKLAAPPVDENHIDVIHPVVVEGLDSAMKIEDAHPVGTLQPKVDDRGNPYLELKSVLTPDKEPAPRVSRDDLGVNMD